jgi:toxin ParE1/3/4
VRDLRLTREARRDLVSIYAESLERFGEEARERYERLMRAALLDLAEDPERTGVQSRAGVSERLYHLRHSRKRAARQGRVRAPRHYIAFRANELFVEIVRVLHDAMDIGGQLEEGGERDD